MDTQPQAPKPIEPIPQLGDTRIPNQLPSLSNAHTDWQNNLPAEEKASIERGIAQADAGQLKSHDEVMKKYQKWS